MINMRYYFLTNCIHNAYETSVFMEIGTIVENIFVFREIKNLLRLKVKPIVLNTA